MYFKGGIPYGAILVGMRSVAAGAFKLVASPQQTPGQRIDAAFKLYQQSEIHPQQAKDSLHQIHKALLAMKSDPSIGVEGMIAQAFDLYEQSKDIPLLTNNGPIHYQNLRDRMAHIIADHAHELGFKSSKHPLFEQCWNAIVRMENDCNSGSIKDDVTKYMIFEQVIPALNRLEQIVDKIEAQKTEGQQPQRAHS